jgi:hypothetical protein
MMRSKNQLHQCERPRGVLALLVLLVCARCGDANHTPASNPDVSAADGGPPADNSQRIGPEGGTLSFPGGIEISIPAGALTTAIDVTMSPLDAVAAESVLSQSGLVTRHLLAAFRAAPDGQSFAIPVHVRLPIAAPSFFGLPAHYVLDPDTGTYNIAWTEITLDPNALMAEIALKSFSSHVVAEVKDAIKNGCPGEAPCRCGRVFAQEQSEDKMFSKQDCQVSRIQGSAQYLDCPGQPTETWLFTEISDGCVPRLDVVPESSDIQPGEQTPVEIKVLDVENRPIANQLVTLAAWGPGSIAPTSSRTQADGTIAATFGSTAQEGTARVEATTTVEYVTSLIAVNGEVVESPTHTIQLATSANIEVTTKPVLYIGIYYGARGRFLEPGETVTVNGAVVRGESEMIDALVHVSVSGPGTLDLDHFSSSLSGVLAGNPPALPQLTAGQSTGRITVTGSATVSYEDDSGQRHSATITGTDHIDVKDLLPDRWQLTFSQTLVDAPATLVDYFVGAYYLTSYQVTGTATLALWDRSCPDKLNTWPLDPEARELMASPRNNVCGTGVSTISNYSVRSTDPSNVQVTSAPVPPDSMFILAGSVYWTEEEPQGDLIIFLGVPASPLPACTFNVVDLRIMESDSVDCMPQYAPPGNSLIYTQLEIPRTANTAHYEGQDKISSWTVDLTRVSR